MSSKVLRASPVVVAIAAAAAAVYNPPPVVQFVEPDVGVEAFELLSEPASYDRPSADSFTEIEAFAR